MSRSFYHKKLLFSIKSAFIRVRPRPSIKAKFIFLLALFFPAAENKAAIQTGAPAVEGPWLLVILIITAASVALLWTVISIVKRRNRRIPMKSAQVDPMPLDGDPSSAPVSMIKPLPEFVDRLKRREELMELGSQPINNAKREKEVVIILPKEAYTSKEE
jgi:hypothetical protein